MKCKFCGANLLDNEKPEGLTEFQKGWAMGLLTGLVALATWIIFF